jgi:hypothetical protein
LLLWPICLKAQEIDKQKLLESCGCQQQHFALASTSVSMTGGVHLGYPAAINLSKQKLPN